MRKTKIIVTLLCFWLGLMPLAAQSLTITKDFAQVPMASVLAMYKNQFGKWEKPDLDITFPYAVVRMHLEGSGREVTMAKQTLTLYMGTQSAVLDRYTENSNEILFLIPARRPTVYVDCGDGCDRVLLVENQQLQPNSVYDCTVQFVPEKLNDEEIDKETLKQELLVELAAVLKGQRGDNITQSDELSNPAIQSDTEPIDFNLIDSAPSNDGGVETFTIRGVSFNMIKVEGGTFTMGGTPEQGGEPDDNEYPTHQVTLSDYYIGETEVTQELWQAVMGDNPSTFSGTNLPVETVNWDDCQVFINKLNYLTGKKFRLPTEAEWEYAARGGNKTHGYKYAGSNAIEDVALIWDGSKVLETLPVKQMKPNELGLYDMSGNVYEWCYDWYGSYKSTAQTNPRGNLSYEIKCTRVMRGGSYLSDSPECRVSFRNGASPCGESKDDFGLRLVSSATTDGLNLVSFIPQNLENGYEYVDLGLSVKWATCNVGATEPEEYGYYFAWGETKPKFNYHYYWDTYKLCNGKEYSLTKYNNRRNYGTIDNKTVLEAADDAATANWGGAWRMPTKAEQDELRENCTWTRTTQNGVNGYRVTSKSNGNSIFLPAAGYRSDSSLNYAGSDGYYWSRSLDTDSPEFAYCLSFSSGSMGWGNDRRHCGQSVRPVCP